MDVTRGTIDIVARTRGNDHYRQVVATGATSQLVVMAIQPGSGIDAEVHHDTDQIIVVVEGSAEIVLDGQTHETAVGQLAYIPAGTRHEVRNPGKDPLRLYTVYAPPEHLDGTVHVDKAEADAYEREHHGG